MSLEELLDSINEEQINRDVIESYKTQIADNKATGTDFKVSFSEHKQKLDSFASAIQDAVNPQKDCINE